MDDGCGYGILGVGIILFLIAAAAGGQGAFGCIGLIGILLLAPFVLSQR